MNQRRPGKTLPVGRNPEQEGDSGGRPTAVTEWGEKKIPKRCQMGESEFQTWQCKYMKSKCLARKNTACDVKWREEVANTTS